MNDGSSSRRFARLVRRGMNRVRAIFRLTPRPAILMYHRIAAESFDPWGLAVSPARFEAQIEWLRRKRTILDLAEFARRHRDGSLPANAVAITFDDGYACTAAMAVPMLQRMGIAATVFIAPELMRRQRQFWWDELQRLLLDHPEGKLRLDDEDFDLGRASGRDRSWRPGAAPQTPRQQAFWRLWQKLRAKPQGELEAAMDGLRSQSRCGEHCPNGPRPMTPEEARSMRSDVIRCGSHTLTHASLPRLDLEEKRREIVLSVEQCAAITGERPEVFAYPFGEFDEASERLVGEAGFICAVTTENRTVGSESSAFALPRVAVGDWTPAQLRRALGSL